MKEFAHERTVIVCMMTLVMCYCERTFHSFNVFIELGAPLKKSLDGVITDRSEILLFGSIARSILIKRILRSIFDSNYDYVIYVPYEKLWEKNSFAMWRNNIWQLVQTHRFIFSLPNDMINYTMLGRSMAPLIGFLHWHTHTMIKIHTSDHWHTRHLRARSIDTVSHLSRSSATEGFALRVTRGIGHVGTLHTGKSKFRACVTRVASRTVTNTAVLLPSVPPGSRVQHASLHISLVRCPPCVVLLVGISTWRRVIFFVSRAYDRRPRHLRETVPHSRR